MISEYLDKAMQYAQFKRLVDGTIFGSFPKHLGLRGAWSDADTEVESRTELREVLEDWILVRISKQLPIPTIDGVSIDVDSPARGKHAAAMRAGYQMVILRADGTPETRVVTPDLQARAADVQVSDDRLTLTLIGGRVLSVPLAWFPRLEHAAQSEREDWRLLGDG
jgi:predicted RNase H-like HicB family nuclease